MTIDLQHLKADVRDFSKEQKGFFWRSDSSNFMAVLAKAYKITGNKSTVLERRCF